MTFLMCWISIRWSTIGYVLSHSSVVGFAEANHPGEQNFSVMGEYMSPMGRIEHSSKTGLRPVNQRRIARAIRRSIGIGMMPSVHRHPEKLYKEAERTNQQTSANRSL